MRIKRVIAAAALTTGVLAFGSAPAHAIPLPPPGGANLTVISYYDGQQLVGQSWSGCGQSGQWGTLAGSSKVSFTAC
ncbi:hypothetical protein FHS43_005123 [Streptosporangium becharense]|uniref:Uncharacterized protein n=1 Tax=Streptosporangium becharense TaxID=1816182 RepID=A0A7W9IJE9_9ACTN|nr:hypothetical protein [Streptosporangium becharense]MBB2913814.1 hypothetical protein [Streptosporangium becharense]MBB5821525.1 hypothetical protein [Streptosporangium becharense]